ncbi:ubiquitin-protein ligase-like protein E3 [Calycina marina]|uniref:HECT-type E3 ubiquitin transferase n=1 Tax=Calycina marina TaxID=1763456 RepID=A0A9P8CIA7_9HELO|nr:ubiquitin-protein ligase-like protein E3 [Calycina marina]
MAPWTSRILSPNSGNNLNVAEGSAAGAGSVSPIRSRPRITESDILDNAYGIPTLQPLERQGKKSSHGRSMSHPFPSLFHHKKDKDGKKKQHAGVSEDTDEETLSPSVIHHTAHNPTAKQAKVPDNDLKIGQCMTCDSTVRWPKDLNVFRCTVCLTINDLKPILLESKNGDRHRVPTTSKPHTSSKEATFLSPTRVAPISLAKTRQLIDQCVTLYLTARLKHDDSQSEFTQSPDDLNMVEGLPIRKSFRTQFTPSDRPPTPPIHLTAFPTDFKDPYLSRRKMAPDFSRAKTLPYSTSSPGDVFGSHMEQDHRIRSSHGDIDAEPRDQTSKDEYVAGGREKRRIEHAHGIFKPVEEYIVKSFGAFECINKSFSTARPSLIPKSASEGNGRAPRLDEWLPRTDEVMSELDAKTLLLGDFAENGSWWMGDSSEVKSPGRIHNNRGELYLDGPVSLRSPHIDWADVNEWYQMVIHTAKSWRQKLESVTKSQMKSGPPLNTEEVEEELLSAQNHVQRVLLKATESLLKRPGRLIQEPKELRFLLIVLANPLLYFCQTPLKAAGGEAPRPRSHDATSPKKNPTTLRHTGSPSRKPGSAARSSSGQHSGIIKRVLGLISGTSNECHHHLVSWFARFSQTHFQKIADLIGKFVTYRLIRQHGRKREVTIDPTAGLIPSLSGGRSTSAALHAALGVTTQQSKKKTPKTKPVIYDEDWQVKAAARVMALLFAANNSGLTSRGEFRPLSNPVTAHSAGLAARERAQIHGQILPTSDFYNTLLDYSDLIADFEAWESKRAKFVFCQYPFFLSIWAKIQIMEHDARRQMEVKAREAFFDSIMTSKNPTQYLTLKVRRDCLVDDSLRGVSEVVGANSEDIKKGLRIEFKDEEGIDAGGLRKEWFLLLVREVFNPEHGMFTYDPESQYCYFNPNSFETTDQYFLVGILLGLAIYNSTILDVELPPFTFRKLLASGPAVAPGATSHAKPIMVYTLEDLAEYRPSLAAGLRQLLEYEGDVEATFCRDFVADNERYGQVTQVPLCPNGENIPITNANRREFVDLYVRYLLDTAVTRQFEPFKRGFFTVCGGNALSLFRPEEIELLVRGSDEPLDISSIRAVSSYDNWGKEFSAETEPVVQWFWQTFYNATPKDQRKLLSFITGSDRIPAMGATNLVIKISCLGDDCDRFPIARTCFNVVSLYRYSSRQKLETMLWRAVNESEGFGLK